MVIVELFKYLTQKHIIPCEWGGGHLNYHQIIELPIIQIPHEPNVFNEYLELFKSFSEYFIIDLSKQQWEIGIFGVGILVWYYSRHNKKCSSSEIYTSALEILEPQQGSSIVEKIPSEKEETEKWDADKNDEGDDDSDTQSVTRRTKISQRFRAETGAPSS